MTAEPSAALPPAVGLRRQAFSLFPKLSIERDQDNGTFAKVCQHRAANFSQPASAARPAAFSPEESCFMPGSGGLFA
jgi:hypothetical protein